MIILQVLTTWLERAIIDRSKSEVLSSVNQIQILASDQNGI